MFMNRMLVWVKNHLFGGKIMPEPIPDCEGDNHIWPKPLGLDKDEALEWMPDADMLCRCGEKRWSD